MMIMEMIVKGSIICKPKKETNQHEKDIGIIHELDRLKNISSSMNCCLRSYVTTPLWWDGDSEPKDGGAEAGTGGGATDGSYADVV